MEDELPTLEEYLKLREDQVTRILVSSDGKEPVEEIHPLSDMERKALRSVWMNTYYTYQANQHQVQRLKKNIKHLQYIRRQLKENPFQ